MVLPIFAYLLVPIAFFTGLLLLDPDRFRSPKIFRMLILYPTAFILGLFGILGGAGGVVNGYVAALASRQNAFQCVSEDQWGKTGINSLPDWLLSDWILEYFQNFPYCNGNGIVSWESFFLTLNFFVFMLLLGAIYIPLRNLWEEYF